MGTAAARLWHLRRLSLLAELSPAELEELSQTLDDREYRRGALLLDGGRRDTVYLLKRGRVRLYRLTSDGREVTTAIVVPGQLFGRGDLVPAASDGLFAETLEASLVCQAPAAQVMRLMFRRPRLMLIMLQEMVRQTVRTERRLEQLAGSTTVRSRIAITLLDLAESTPQRGTKQVVSQCATRSDWAKLCHTTRESVSRTFAAFASAGLIREDGDIITLLDPVSLERMGRQEAGNRVDARCGPTAHVHSAAG